MINRYFDYPNKKLWNDDIWEPRVSGVFGLVRWIGEHDRPDIYTYPGADDIADVSKLPFYSPKTNAVSLPEVVQYWRKRNVYYECRSQGGVCWIVMAPLACAADYSLAMPTIFVSCTEDLTDPWWAMRTVERYRAYNEMVAQDQNVIIVYVASNGPDLNRIYVNILQEAYVLVPGDMKRIFMDVSCVTKAGVSLKDIPDFKYMSADGTPEQDPDACIVYYGSAGIPVIDISGRWENRTSLTRDQMSGDNWSSRSYDKKRLINSISGAELAEGIGLEYRFNDTYDPEFLDTMRAMGLSYENHVMAYRNWKSAVPLGALGNPGEKLPAILVLQEVNRANEHLAVKEVSYFFEYFRIAAMGECILINFVLEDRESNELLVDILQEACELYPIDRSRVYIAGHSHNGFFSLEFALRHPDLIAAVATFGDPPGLMTVGNLPVVGERLEKLMSIDLPLIDLAGMAEHLVHFPINKTGDDYRDPSSMKEGTAHPYSFREKAESWQLRLKAFNCPMKSSEDIARTAESSNKAIRMTGIPGDRGQTLWMDGFELYIVDIRNNAGRYHLRMVAEENMPHNTTPAQQKISWDFLRRFARNQENGEVIELFE